MAITLRDGYVDSFEDKREHEHETVRIYGGLGVHCPTCGANKVGAGPWRPIGAVITAIE